MADSVTKSDLQSENDRLRALLEDNGINPDQGSGPNLVGNLADLQRIGANAAAEGKTNIDDAVVIPATVDSDGNPTPAQTAAGDPPPEL